MDPADPSTPSPPVSVLLTRPLAASQGVAEALAEKAAEQGLKLDIVVSPILEIRYLPLSTELDSEVSLVLSSAHSVAALERAGQARGQRAYCVGDATARAAERAGLRAISAHGDAAALAELVQMQHVDGPLVWLRGAHVRGDLVARLTDAGVPISEIVVYDQAPQQLSQSAVQVLERSQPVLVPLYSPRSAALVGAACAGATAPLSLVCISDAALQNWAGPAPQETCIAAHPDGPSMLDALLCRAVDGRSA